MDGTIQLEGSLVNDVEIRYGQNQNPWATFTIRVSQRVGEGKGYNGGNYDSFFMECVIFGEQAERLAASAKKGTNLLCSGRLQNSTWEDKNSGEKRSKLRLRVDVVALSLRWSLPGEERVSSSASTYQPVSKASDDDYAYEEEPF
jgi:single-strand DNA-binding protein